MSERLADVLEQKYPALYHLLVYVLANQYYPDVIDRAIKEFNRDSDRSEREAAIKELDIAIEQRWIPRDQLELFINHILPTPDAAQALLIRLRKGIADDKGLRLDK